MSLTVWTTELYILWSELSHHPLLMPGQRYWASSPMWTQRVSWIGLAFGGNWAEIFTRTWQPCHSWSSKMAVHWRHWLCRPKLTPVSLISMDSGGPKEPCISLKHPACKNWVMRCRCSYLSGARCRLFACGPADATASRTPIISCLI